MSERKSNSLPARHAALQCAYNCQQMALEERRLEVRALLKHLRAVTGAAESLLDHCDTFDLAALPDRVKRARKFVKRYDPPAKTRRKK